MELPKRTINYGSSSILPLTLVLFRLKRWQDLPEFLDIQMVKKNQQNKINTNKKIIHIGNRLIPHTFQSFSPHNLPPSKLSTSLL
jgi:hypothetical protein